MERALTVTCHLGLCNRLRVLLSGKAIAQATQRAFAMRWVPTVGCGATFDQLFQNDWNVRADIELEQYQWLDTTGLALHAFPDLLAASEDRLAIENNGWMLRPTLYPAHVALEQRCREFMQELAPLPQISEQVEIFRAHNFRATMIGVHLRRGDFMRWRPDTVGNMEASFRVIDNWLDAAGDAGLLVCTDDGAPDPNKERATPRQEIVTHFVKRYGVRVVVPQTTTQDRREPRAIQDALRDLWLLRQTDFFVGTMGSSFSELAAFGRTIPIVQTGHPTPRHAREMLWLERLRIAPLLARWSDAKFGKQVPYIYFVIHALGRIEFIRAYWTKRLRRAR